MSVLDRVRPALPSSLGGPPPTQRPPGGLGDVLAAAAYAVAAAAVSLVLISLPMLLGWAVQTTEASWGGAVDVAAHVFLLAHFGSLDVGGQPLSLTPLLLAALPFLVVQSAALRVAQRSWAVLGAFVGGYAGCVLSAAAITASGPVPADLLRAAVGGLAFPAAAYGLALLWFGEVAAPRAPAWLVPTMVTIRRALAPAGWGVAALLGSGAGLVLAMATWHAAAVHGVYAGLQPGLVGGLLLTAGQLLAVPNLAAWAVSFMAGPGFALGAGQSVGWAASEASALPLVPVFAALPAPGPLPSWAQLLVALPVAVGVLVGWRSLRVLSRLSAAGVKLRTAAASCVLCALGMVGVTWLAGGGLAAARLQHLGAAPWAVGGALLGELSAGALLAVLWSAWRAKRR